MTAARLVSQFILMAVLLAAAPTLRAHQTIIENVTITEMDGQRYGIRYNAPPPGLSDFAAPILPAHCKWIDPVDLPVSETSTSLVFEATGRPLAAEDRIILPWRNNGVMVEMKWRDGSSGRQFFLSGAEGIIVEMAMLKAGSGSLAVTTRRYAVFGIEHILGGIDHLLFVAGLLLLVKGTRTLILTITAFTIGHSTTLALSVLGWLTLPSGPVEAIIALSIVLLAVENVHQRQGKAGLTSRKPWLVSAAFGLIHGLGFAGALGELGLPQAEVPAALFFFNLGVEAGQLLFVAVWLAGAWLLSKMKFKLPARLSLAPHYALGVISTYWLFERSLAMLSA